METLNVMDASHYFTGISNISGYNGNSSALSPFFPPTQHPQHFTLEKREPDNGNYDYDMNSGRWDDPAEYKPDITTIISNNNNNENAINKNNHNFDYPHPSDNRAPCYSGNYHHPPNEAYHLSTSERLPTWYSPPISPPVQFPSQYYGHPSHGLHQHPHMYQNYAVATSSTSEHMLNIHLSNRYDYDLEKNGKIINGREARNRAEKNRRDKLNGSIQELSTMVPHVAESPRRVDKTAVLRFSAHGLRTAYVFGESSQRKYHMKTEVTEGMMKLLDSFLLVMCCRGQIVSVSSSVEQFLGHCQTDLLGQNVVNITHPEDHAFLKQQLIPQNLNELFAHKTDESGEARPRTMEEEAEIDKKLCSTRRDFTIRMARAGPRSEPVGYEMVRINGYFRRSDSAPRGKLHSPSGLQLIRRARGRDDSIPLHSINGNDLVLIAMARVIKRPSICDRLIESCSYEYKTRHLVDGRIVQCDQRISIVAGYLTDEVSGLSPFTFMHRDDVRWVMVALRQMYDQNKPQGESCYRLMARSGKFIYLKTRGYLEVDETTHQVHSFICINTLVPEDEGKRLVREMKKKFSVMINKAEYAALESDIPAVENPEQIEKAIFSLINNLNMPSGEDDTLSAISDSTIDNDELRFAKSPPLAIIPPKSSSIKPSVARSHNVIGKEFVVKEEPLSPPPPQRASVLHKNYSMTNSNKSQHNFKVKEEPALISADEDCPEDGSSSLRNDKLETLMRMDVDESSNSSGGSFIRSTVLKRVRSESGSRVVAKKRTISLQELVDARNADIQTILPATFHDLGESLNHIEDATTRLKDHYTQHDIPNNKNQRLDDIIDEHHHQQEMLHMIQVDYKTSHELQSEDDESKKSVIKKATDTNS